MSSTIPLSPREQLYNRYYSNERQQQHLIKQPKLGLRPQRHALTLWEQWPASAERVAHAFPQDLDAPLRLAAQRKINNYSPAGWAPDPRWAGGLVLHQTPWSFGFDSQDSERRQRKQAHPVLKLRVSHGSPAPRGLLPGLEKQSRTRSGKSGGVDSLRINLNIDGSGCCLSPTFMASSDRQIP
jgi:hypothetical protein